jgi:ribonuclease P protein component
MFKLKKSEILREYKLINEVKISKNIIKTELFNVKYIVIDKKDSAKTKCLFYVPKKLFKRAVDRNKIRRRIKESYRLNKDKINVYDNKTLVLSLLYKCQNIEKYDNINENLLKIIDYLNLSVK